MQRGFIALVCWCFASAAWADATSKNAEQTARWSTALEANLQSIARGFKGEISLYVSDDVAGVTFRHNTEKPSYLASAVKFPFMVEVFRQRSLGTLSFEEEIPYTEDDVRDGAPRLNKEPFGKRFKIRQLLEFMVQASDNSASDMLARRVGLENVNVGLKAMGFEGFGRFTYLIDVRRGMYRELGHRVDDLTPAQIRDIRWTSVWDPQARKVAEVLGLPAGSVSKEKLQASMLAYYESGSNFARVDSYGLVLEALARRQLINAEASEEMAAIMFGAKTSTSRLLGRLPPGTRVAHKTGSQYERICDMGLIELPDAKSIIVACCVAGGNDRTRAEAVVAELTRTAYDLALPLHPKLQPAK
ncbi:MAG: serine hydrolase [Deltaproteobacteria bacterium]|nr:serine hydrolase [Deltaproteobacteria bacterium]